MSLLEEITKKYALGLASSGDLVVAANAALDQGVYSDSLADLALASAPIMSDVGPLFEQALKELGIPIPSAKEAALGLVKWYVTEIVDGACSPETGAYALREVVRTKDLELRNEFAKTFGKTAMWPLADASNYDDIGAGELPESVKPVVDNSVIANSMVWLQVLSKMART